MFQRRLRGFIFIVWSVFLFNIPNVFAISCEKGTLNRFPDPVLIQAEKMPSVTGGSLQNYRIFASQNGNFEPIRFQIDEMTKKGDLIFHHGKKTNSKESNGKLDPRDIVLFMAHDAGDKVSETFWPKNTTKSAEIEVVDPRDKSRSWVYMFYFEKDPPPLCPLPDYFSYDYDSETLQGEYWKAKYIVTKDGKHTTFYEYQAALPKAGGTGESYVDRLKVRAEVSLFFGKIKFRVNEEKLCSDTLSWIQGPIRVVKRVEQWVKAPLGMKVLRAVVDVQYYETLATVPVNFILPFKVDAVITDAIISFGTDYSPAVKGSTYYSSTNPQGILIDGKMTGSDHNFNREREDWNVITGDWGSYMTRIIIPEYLNENLTASQDIVDDEDALLPPENIPGSIGYITQDLNISKVPRGKHTIYMEFYTPPNYKPGDEVAYLNYLDHPLVVKIKEKEFVSQVKLIAKVSKKF